MDQDNCTHDCSTCGEDCSGEEFLNEVVEDTMHRLSVVKKTIIFASAKGGVGKSFVTSLLACELKNKGYRVGILDGDLSGSTISLLFGTAENPEIIKGGMFPVQTENGISIISLPLLTSNPSAPLIWDGPRAAAFAKQFWMDVIWDTLDFLLIDTPSDTCDTTQMLFNLPTIDGVIAITDPSEISTILTSRTVNYAKICKLNIVGLIENYADDAMKADYTEELTKNFNIPLLDKVAFDKELYQNANDGKIHAKKTKLFDQTVQTLIGMLDK